MTSTNDPSTGDARGAGSSADGAGGNGPSGTEPSGDGDGSAPSRDDLPGGDHHRTFDPATGETPTEAVITTVAEATGRSPLEMEPLVGSVDPEALNAVLDGEGPDPTDSTVAVVFDYAGHRVLVTAGEVRVRSQE